MGSTIEEQEMKIQNFIHETLEPAGFKKAQEEYYPEIFGNRVIRLRKDHYAAEIRLEMLRLSFRFGYYDNDIALVYDSFEVLKHIGLLSKDIDEEKWYGMQGEKEGMGLVAENLPKILSVFSHPGPGWSIQKR